MIIAMTLSMSGGRYDDRQWPPVGVPFEVPDWEGEGLVRDRNAVRLPDPEPEKAPEPEREVVFRDEAVAAVGDLPAAEPEPEPAPEPVPEPVPAAAAEPVPAEPPSAGDPKPAWVAWAVSRGEDETTAGNMSKADLMSKHGGRL